MVYIAQSSKKQISYLRSPANGVEDTQKVSMFVKDHEIRLINSARRFSLCADDAQDALQRALEIMITKAPDCDGPGLLAWMHTVVRNEALAVRRKRLRLLEGANEEIDPAILVCDRPGPEEQMESCERILVADAALQRLKYAEAECLMLKAKGFSYNEISKLTGYSWTKVNRCISEGRRSFLERFNSISRGDECHAYQRELMAPASEGVNSSIPAAVRAHLRCCSSCRAFLSKYGDLITKAHTKVA